MKPSDLVKVKALEWGSRPGLKHAFYELYVIDKVNTTGEYVVFFNNAWLPDMPINGYATLADAKAACQAHYESMIYELLEVR